MMASSGSSGRSFSESRVADSTYSVSASVINGISSQSLMAFRTAGELPLLLLDRRAEHVLHRLRAHAALLLRAHHGLRLARQPQLPHDILQNSAFEMQSASFTNFIIFTHLELLRAKDHAKQLI